MRKGIALILVMALLLCGCGGNVPDPTEDTTVEIPGCDGDRPLDGENTMLTRDDAGEIVTDFALRLFQESMQAGENTLISPLSVLSALAMTANGAEGETLTQMQQVLGMDTESLNLWIRGYMEDLPDSEYGQLHLANGIWFRDADAFTVNKDFLQINRDYFDAGVSAAPFDDSTLRDINDFVKEHTHGMIESILDSIPEEAVMYLVNALAFEAQWANPYDELSVDDGVFITESGARRQAELMYASVHNYLELDNATGFLRNYEGSQYAFAALLPNEGVTVEELVRSLDASELTALLDQPENVEVRTAIPKFESETGLEMSELLQNMGMTDAFSDIQADLSGLGTYKDGNVYIGQVLHKTYIQVAEQGTRAGAATVVANYAATGAVEEEIKTVYLDRPFVYMIIDRYHNFPFFIGTCMDLDR